MLTSGLSAPLKTDSPLQVGGVLLAGKVEPLLLGK